MTYSFHPLAESEHLSQIAYYEEKRAGLGAMYLAEFDRTIQYICDGPGRHKVVGENIRLVGMKLFRSTFYTEYMKEKYKFLQLHTKDGGQGIGYIDLNDTPNWILKAWLGDRCIVDADTADKRRAEWHVTR